MKKKYTSSDIEVLKGIEPVQKRPGMYTDTSNPNHLVQELIDNSVDEAISGFCNSILITLDKDNSITVEDDGRGMPVDKHPEHKVSGVEVIMTNLHSGAKFSNKNYKFSGGLHGVGVSIVNALAAMLEISVYRLDSKKEHRMSFLNGSIKKKLGEHVKSKNKKQGTIIKFIPNEKYFDTIDVDIKSLLNLIKAKSILQPELKLTLDDKKYGSGISAFYHKGTLREYIISQFNKDTNILPNETYSNSIDCGDFSMDWSCAWVDSDVDNIQESFVNLIPTSQGGTHVNAFRNAVIDSIRNYCTEKKLMTKQIKILPDDVWKHITFIVSLKMMNPQFAGQTKNKLQSNNISSELTSKIKDNFDIWLNKNPQKAEQIAKHILANAELRLIISNPCSGPALSLKESLQVNINDENIDFSILNNLITKEEKWLNNKDHKKRFILQLEKLGWNISFEEWTEFVYQKVDNTIIKRWLDQGSEYREIILKNCEEETLIRLQELFKILDGQTIKQKLIHTKFLAKNSN